MRLVYTVWLLVLLCVAIDAGRTQPSGTTWAVVVAGSSQFYNYRHQADACHANQLLAKNGVASENIIMMYYDDIANDPMNPFPGQIFNKPTAKGVAGSDVYAQCQKDYTGNDVTATNFLNVITGNSTAMQGIGNGKVLRSGPEDRVFIFFTDHGGTGIIAFPTGPFLEATELHEALTKMHKSSMYGQLVFYMEACESGSMFQDLLLPGMEIYATTASNAEESSYGTYCPPEDSINGTEIGSCLGDTYNVSWMENADLGIMTETLEEQYLIVRNETTMSEVCQFGQLAWVDEHIGDFEGDDCHGAATRIRPPEPVARRSQVDSRDAKLQFLMNRYVKADQQTMRHKGLEVIAEIESRLKADEIFEKLAHTVAGPSAASALLHGAATLPYDCGTCCKAVHTEYERIYGWTDYSLKYVRVVYNMCRALNKEPEVILRALRTHNSTP